jgi:hypothetical protein
VVMDWADFSAAAGTMLPGLAICTVVMVVGCVAVLGRIATQLRRLMR